MFLIKKLIAHIILPPGCFIILLLVIGTWLARSRRKVAAFCIYLLALLLWFSSTQWAAGRLIHSLEREWHIPSTVKGDVIVLIGGGIHSKAADFSGLGVPSEDMFGRMVTAVRLQKKYHLPIIVSGGAVYEYSTPEAPVIKRILVDLGVPSQQIFTEEKSRDTVENARYSMEICRRQGFSTPLLVTSAYHLRRAVAAFKGQGANVLPYPAFFRTGSETERSWTRFLPSSGALHLTSSALREYIGLAFYRVVPPR